MEGGGVKDKKHHPIEHMMSLPAEGPRIVDVSGQTVFPIVAEVAECCIFVEYNGYRKQVNFPIKPATPTPLPLAGDQEK